MDNIYADMKELVRKAENYQPEPKRIVGYLCDEITSLRARVKELESGKFKYASFKDWWSSLPELNREIMCKPDCMTTFNRARHLKNDHDYSIKK